ncbi:uncharacterized protein Z518_00929 [Rhinocladiella mackenziei CBS 650.93]|uniref:NB-ARC domain-containing protein n=1 Tax=Rhinocladiella mackenziei CBS 650.93 TaxID=1442369 RepID=A0A0D2HGP7_9EURO|nr:uncharacterized protein Z518_00929 [Rhinocladiella mackenziei CBS 650.93]KIX09848.1 hypothetical protein Z518_00929 [Rhinocladiella mackenziei CBS 650.93]
MTDHLEAEWNRFLNTQQHRLRKKRYSSLVQRLDYQRLLATLTDESSRYANNGVTRGISKLRPCLDRLNDFMLPITSIVQASPAIASFIWGTLQALIVVSSKFNETLETVVNMIQDLTSTMTRINKYLNLFPTEPDLRACMRHLIEEYVGFCITTMKYCSRMPIYNLCRIFWSRIDRKFEEARARIENHVRDFESERQYAVDSALVQGSRRIEAALPLMQPLSRTPNKLYVVPHAQNARFCGQADVLRLLQQFVVQGQTSGRQTSIALHGIGGIGKTQIAVQFAYQCRRSDSFDFILWFRADSQAELSAGMASLTHPDKLNLPQVAPGAGQNKEVELVRTFLESTTQRFLLVFDNAESWATVEAYLPRCIYGTILITTQHKQLAKQATYALPVKPMDRIVGARLLLSHLPGQATTEQKEIARLICDELGGLPIAIAHVAGFIRELTGLHGFLDMFKERANSSAIFDLPAPTTVATYEKRLGLVWDFALNQVSSDSLTLLHILSMLSPDGVPVDDLHHRDLDSDLAFLRDPNNFVFRQVVNQITDRQLVDYQTVGGNACFVMHRSLQRSILHRLDGDQDRLQHIFQITADMLRRVVPRQHEAQIPSSELWPSWERRRPQVMSLADVYRQSATKPKVSIDFAEMLCDIANYCWERCLLRDGLVANQLAESICDMIQGHFDRRADIYAIGGGLRMYDGISGRATNFEVSMKALNLRQQHIDETLDETITAMDCFKYSNAWSDIGETLLDYGCYAAAGPYFELSMSVKYKIGTDIVYLINEYHKAIALAGQGMYEAAVQELREATATMESVMGPTCAAVQSFRLGFACLLLCAGQLEPALDQINKVISCREVLFGRYGRPTLDAYYVMSVIQERRGDLTNAYSWLSIALDRPTDWCPADIGRANWKSAVLLAALNRQTEAKTHQDRADHIMSELKSVGDFRPRLLTLEGEALWDHMVALSAGRTSYGSFVEDSISSTLDARCAAIVHQLRPFRDGQCAVVQMASILRSPNGSMGVPSG